jgi:8-oxo-dGTP pyrophosphatase MutT (NUDIX family)
VPAVVPARRPRPGPQRGHRRDAHRASAQETSAGGLVVRTIGGDAEAALIGRLDRYGRLRWSLPKGHVEPGETTEQTAVREVREETGITGSIVAPLGSLSYSFMVSGRRVYKRVHHFLMTAESGELSDADVEVTEVAWVPVHRLQRVLAYTAERRIAQRAEKMLADIA